MEDSLCWEYIRPDGERKAEITSFFRIECRFSQENDFYATAFAKALSDQDTPMARLQK
jgi:hypothetical protein